MKTIKYEVKGGESAGRLELFIRIAWSIPSIIVACVLAVFGTIAYVLQFIHILLFGKRHKELHKLIWMMMDYTVKWKTYMCLLTDERNPLMPEEK